MSWQDEITKDVENFGLRITSGYRSPQHNAAIGGAPGSFHTRGTPSAPGAIDVSGPAADLTDFFNLIKKSFAGRINELYLNIPGGKSEAIRSNRTLSSNPEEGRPQHLHIALGVSVNPTLTPSGDRRTTMRFGTDVANAGSQLGDKGIAALKNIGLTPEGVGIDQGSCTSKACLPGVLGGGCMCWSDFWFYGGGIVVGALGIWMIFSGRE